MLRNSRTTRGQRPIPSIELTHCPSFQMRRSHSISSYIRRQPSSEMDIAYDLQLLVRTPTPSIACLLDNPTALMFIAGDSNPALWNCRCDPGNDSALTTNISSCHLYCKPSLI